MIINITNNVIHDNDNYGQAMASESGPGMASHYHGGYVQYPSCQSYVEEPYHYPSHYFGTTPDACSSWSSQRFYLEGDCSSHSASLSPEGMESYGNHCPGTAGDQRLYHGNGYSNDQYDMTSQQNTGGHHSACPDGQYTRSEAGDVAELLMTVTSTQKSTSGRTSRNGVSPAFSDSARLGATERERTRMHMLNDAFDDLRKVSVGCGFH